MWTRSRSRIASPSAAGKPTAHVGADAAAHRVERVGARVLFVDASGPEPQLLMILGHDPHLPSRSFWFTPGGGLEPGEGGREGAVRELGEETGFQLAPHELIGPVWRRTAVFDFASRPFTQHEEFYVGWRSDADARPLTPKALTRGELEAIDAVAWMTCADLRADTREVFPARLLAPWEEFLSWDGVTRDFGQESE
jgi:8-oxo-dGTP pyrophosphatase MutT (NUDIX family)